MPKLLAIAAAMAATLGLAAVGAASPPSWSSQLTDAGFVWGAGSDGPTCLFAHHTAQGPRLFVGGEFTAVRNAGVPMPAMALAIWDGAAWSGMQGGGLPGAFGSPSVLGITTMPIGGGTRVILAGFFDAPGTDSGIGYLDDARALHGMSANPISHAWYGSAFGWTPPSAPPPALPAVPEVIVTSGIFPQGSEYAYRYTPTGYGLMPPGIITVTTAFCEFDDGGGRALFIGVPRAGAAQGERLSKWNGSTITGINPGQMTWCLALCVHDDGGGSGPALYAAGHGFRRFKNGVWEAVTGTGAPLNNIDALASFDDGTGPALYAAGQFTTVTSTGASAVNIVRLRNGVWEVLGTGLAGGVPKAMGVFDEDGAGPRKAGLFVVGKFLTAGGSSSVGIARWGQPACPPDHNGVGGLDVQDIFAYLTDWFAGNTRADFDNSGGLPTVGDIFAFLTAWFAGC